MQCSPFTTHHSPHRRNVEFMCYIWLQSAKNKLTLKQDLTFVLLTPTGWHRFIFVTGKIRSRFMSNSCRKPVHQNRCRYLFLRLTFIKHDPPHRATRQVCTEINSSLLCLPGCCHFISVPLTSFTWCRLHTAFLLPHLHSSS